MLSSYTLRDRQTLRGILREYRGSSVDELLALVEASIAEQHGHRVYTAEHARRRHLDSGSVHGPASYRMSGSCPECGWYTYDRQDGDTGEVIRVCQRCWYSWLVE